MGRSTSRRRKLASASASSGPSAGGRCREPRSAAAVKVLKEEEKKLKLQTKMDAGADFCRNTSIYSLLEGQHFNLVCELTILGTLRN